MAQWNGQFTGNSHSTKVRDCEESLRHAVSALRESAMSDRAHSKRKAVLKFAEKLKIARAKLLKAKIDEVEPVDEDSKADTDKRLTRLREQLASLENAGIDGILVEFQVLELITTE